MRVREPAVAGMFYPDDPTTLTRDVDAFVAEGRAARAAERPPKVLVAPHAGYVYSGPIAGRGYATVAARAGEVERVVLVGPAHRVPLAGLAVPSVDAFVTPLGAVEIDAAARDIALTCDGVVVDDVAHRDEHSLEVHLPFIQRVLGPVRVLPIVVGRAPRAMVGVVLDALWGGDETLIVVSTDLSHYESYESARAHDRRTAHTILAGDAEGIGPTDACGAFAVRGLLDVAPRRSAHGDLLDLRNSGDTAGPRDRVVGYGAFAFTCS